MVPTVNEGEFNQTCPAEFILCVWSKRCYSTSSKLLLGCFCAGNTRYSVWAWNAGLVWLLLRMGLMLLLCLGWPDLCSLLLDWASNWWITAAPPSSTCEKKITQRRREGEIRTPNLKHKYQRSFHCAKHSFVLMVSFIILLIISFHLIWIF